MPGLHFITFPVETLRPITWSYVGQDNRLRVLNKTIASFDAEQMDIPVIPSISKDQARVDVDGTVMYRITDLKAAVYETNDVLNFFYQCVQQAVRNIVSTTNVTDMHGRDSEFGVRVTEYVNKLLEGNDKQSERGIRCHSFIVQSVRLDQRIVDANQQIYALKRQQEMTADQKRAEHALALSALKMQEELQQHQARLAMDTLKAELERAAFKSEQEAERDCVYRKKHLELGFTTDQVLDMHKSSQLAASNAKVIYVPMDMFKTQKTICTLNEGQ